MTDKIRCPNHVRLAPGSGPMSDIGRMSVQGHKLNRGHRGKRVDDVPRKARSSSRSVEHESSPQTFLQLTTAAALPLPGLHGGHLRQPVRYCRLPCRRPYRHPGALASSTLSERLRQQFIVEDQPGAGTNLATERVVRALHFSYATRPHAINATLYDNLKFNFIRDITPIASIARTPLLMEVNPSFPAKTVPDFIAYAKANPGKINMATAGIGSSVHLAGELFMTMTGVQLVPVHYRSFPICWRDKCKWYSVPYHDRAGQGRQVARPSSDQWNTFAGAAGCSDGRRLCTGLRGKCVEWRSRAEEHACRDHR